MLGVRRDRGPFSGGLRGIGGGEPGEGPHQPGVAGVEHDCFVGRARAVDELRQHLGQGTIRVLRPGIRLPVDHETSSAGSYGAVELQRSVPDDSNPSMKIKGLAAQL
jgi:hypothetical protein